ncbi:MAG: hypothetical protein ABW116_14970 [Candidatus Sedimenticola sp. 20ELBAFRAG]
MGRRKLEPENKKQPLALRMNNDHIQTIKRLADEKGVTQISIIEKALAEYFARNQMKRLN